MYLYAIRRLEDDYVLRRSTSDMGDDDNKATSIGAAATATTTSSTRRNSGATRRSFFRRKNKHQRSGSRDSRELHSVSDVSINSDSLSYLDGKLTLISGRKLTLLP